MAKDGGIDTSGSQFFITFVETKFLDPFEADGTPKNCEAREVSCHLVFGRVVEGDGCRERHRSTRSGDRHYPWRRDQYHYDQRDALGLSDPGPLPTDVVHLYFFARPGHRRPLLRVAVFADAPYLRDKVGQLSIARTRAQRGAEICAQRGEQTRYQPSLRR